MKFTKEQAFELVEADGADMFMTGNWRHGHSERWVAPFEGKFYAFWVDVHHSEGWQIDDGVEAVEVKKVAVQSFKWVEV